MFNLTNIAKASKATSGDQAGHMWAFLITTMQPRTERECTNLILERVGRVRLLGLLVAASGVQVLHVSG